MACNTTASKKQKGRKFQQVVRDALRTIGLAYGLEAADVESTGMGQSGVDVILSPAARRIFDWYIECKNVESLNVITTFHSHYAKYATKDGLKLLFHTKNHTKPLVTLRMDDFMKLITDNLEMRTKLKDVN